jgi:tRNA threonylcarbamoyladenosine biosynthesis protein TsaE
MPILSSHSLEIISRSAEQTRRVGMRLGTLLKTGDVIHLIGELGAGKTTFVQGVSAGWGSLDPATSPTFVLVNVYRRPDSQVLYHLDAYRLSGAQDAWELDLDEMFEKGPLLIEWADRICEALPVDFLSVKLTLVDENQRDLLIDAHGSRYETLLTAFRKGVYGG